MQIKPLPKHCKACKQTCKIKSDHNFARAMAERAKQIKALPPQHEPSKAEVERKLIARKNHVRKMESARKLADREKQASNSAYKALQASQTFSGTPYHAESSKPVTGYRRHGEVRNGLFALVVCKREEQFKPRTKQALKAERFTAHKLAYMLQPDRREYHDDSILDLTYTRPVRLCKADQQAIQCLPDGMYTVIVRNGIKVLIPVKKERR